MSMMPRTRLFVRSLLALLLVAACFAAMAVPLLGPVRAAPQRAVNGIPSASPGDLVISAFRFKGPSNDADEYIELFNRSCSTTNSIDLKNYTFTSSDGAGGYTDLQITFKDSTIIEPKHYFLLAGPSYSDATVADASYQVGGSPSGISSSTGGLIIFAPGNTTTAVDQVGFASVDGYFEGTSLTAKDTDQTYVRDRIAGKYIDTNDNAADFVVDNAATPQNSGQTGTCGIPATTVNIRGNVQVPGATVGFTGGTPVTSGANGDYSLSVPSGWTGSVTPTKSGFTFSPASRPYKTAVTTDQLNQNFSASLTTPSFMSVRINEVGWMGTRANAPDQWLELYNPNNYSVNVHDLQLVGSGIGSNGVFNLSDAGLSNDVLPAHGFLLILDRAAVFQNLPGDSNGRYTYNNITYTLKTKVLNLSLSTYGTSLVLYNPSTFITVDTANYFYGHGAWPAGNNSSASARASMERHDASPDSRFAWYTFAGTAHPNTVLDAEGDPVKGTPGEPNWADTVTATPSPVPTHYKTPTPLPPTPYAHMVLNEFLPRAGFDWNQDGSVDVFDEFVELKNLGPIAAQLSGWRIDVISPGGTSIYSLPSTTLQPNQRALYYSLQTKLSLYDSGGTVRLINNRGVIVDARSYGPVQGPDQSTCRIPDGYYWRFPCFPTPGLENSLTGTLPVPPPIIASQPPPCLLADTVPDPFKQAECYGFGGDIFNPAYWDNQAGFNSYPVPDNYDKNGSVVK